MKGRFVAKKRADKELYERMRASGVRKKVARQLAELPRHVTSDSRAPKPVRDAIERLQAVVDELRGHAGLGEDSAPSRKPARRSASASRASARKPAGTRRGKASSGSTSARKPAGTRRSASASRASARKPAGTSGRSSASGATRTAASGSSGARRSARSRPKS